MEVLFKNEREGKGVDEMYRCEFPRGMIGGKNHAI